MEALTCIYRVMEAKDKSEMIDTGVDIDSVVQSDISAAIAVLLSYHQGDF